MKRKKAFTLAEILIVLMVIGLIATLSVPSLLKGIYQAQWRSGFKKAYNVIKNMYASEKLGGSTIGSSDSNAVLTLFVQMVNNISPTGYVAPFSLDEISSGKGVVPSDIYSSVGYTLFGREHSGELSVEISDTSPWVISQDNFAYCVIKGNECKRISEINSMPSHNEALNASCLAGVADVNGLQNSPNSTQDQTIDANAKTPQLTSDRFFIYVGTDGITAGSTKNTLSGRIIADSN